MKKISEKVRDAIRDKIKELLVFPISA